MFYVSMTMHGAGMVGIAGLGGVGDHVVFRATLRAASAAGIFVANSRLLVWSAPSCSFGAGFIGGFAAGWTFLFPLPAISGFQWSPARGRLLFGLVSIGVGFLLFYLDVARAVMLASIAASGPRSGSNRCWASPRCRKGPPPAVTASTMVTDRQHLGLVFGAAVLAVSLINLIPAVLRSTPRSPRT